VTIYETALVEITGSYAAMAAARRLLDPPAVRLESERFTQGPVLELAVRTSRLPALLSALEDARLEFRVRGG
jgi:hypothetical protein